MKRIFTVLLTLVFTLSITAMPVFAKGGGGGKGGGGKSSSSIGSSVKGDNGVHNDKSDSVFKNTINSNKEKNSSTVKAIGIKAVGGKGSTAEYSDTSGHWASKSINTLKALGIINGYQDGSFRPDNPVSSTEAVVLMVKLAETLDTDEETTEENPGEEIASEETEDEDSSDEESSEETVSEQAPNWAKESFKQAGTRGIINLNRFHSQVQASRVECAVMLAKALGLEPELGEGQLPFSDAGFLDGQDLGYLAALMRSGIIHGSPDGKFNPNSSITRGEIAAMLAAAIQPDIQPDETDSDSPADVTDTDEIASNDTTAEDSAVDSEATS